MWPAAGAERLRVWARVRVLGQHALVCLPAWARGHGRGEMADGSRNALSQVCMIISRLCRRAEGADAAMDASHQGTPVTLFFAGKHCMQRVVLPITCKDVS